MFHASFERVRLFVKEGCVIVLIAVVSLASPCSYHYPSTSQLPPSFDPPPVPPGFLQARETAKSELKWLMVTLHDPTEFACQTMNRDLWKDSSVVEVIKNSFIFQQVRKAGVFVS